MILMLHFAHNKFLSFLPLARSLARSLAVSVGLSMTCDVLSLLVSTFNLCARVYCLVAPSLHIASRRYEFYERSKNL